MHKIHTKKKRKYRMPTHTGPYDFFHPTKRKGARTFKTEKEAQEWAVKQGLKDYALKKAKKGKKFQIVTEKELARFGIKH